MAAVFYLGGGWYFSGQIRDEITVTAPGHERDLRVEAVTGGSVTLRAVGTAPEALGEPRLYGLDWTGGFGQVGAVLGTSGDRVTRALLVLAGAAPRVGDPARLVRDAFPDDPRVALGRAVQDVTIRSDGRDLPAWFVPGASRTWAVLVHGKGTTRTEMLRLMRTTTALGLPSLDISYRRDAETGGGLMRFGQDEWPDLEAAVRYALDQGAARVVLLGASAGGSVSASFLENSPLRSHVVANVFDAANLDFGATVEHAAAERTLPLVGVRVPSSLVWVAQQIAGVRFGLDSRRTDYLDDLDWLSVPTLAFQGTADDTVPPAITTRLAAARPGLVRAELVDGAGHVESWNTAPVRYDREVRRFLTPYVG